MVWRSKGKRTLEEFLCRRNQGLTAKNMIESEEQGM